MIYPIFIAKPPPYATTKGSRMNKRKYFGVMFTLSPGFGSLLGLLNWVILLFVCNRLHALVYGLTNSSCRINVLND
jgi:hypothetical protein